MKRRVPLLIGITWLIWGCSPSGLQSLETFQYVWQGVPDAALTRAQVAELPYASAYVRIEGQPRAFVVLAYVDGDRLAWLSHDGVLFVTRHGRLVRTVGLENDLTHIEGLAQDPLATGRLDREQRLSWQSSAEWSHHYTSGYPLTAHYQRHHKAMYKGWPVPYMATLIEERLRGPQGVGWSNWFWIDERTGVVRRSLQQLGPNLPYVEITYLKPYAS